MISGATLRLICCHVQRSFSTKSVNVAVPSLKTTEQSPNFTLGMQSTSKTHNTLKDIFTERISPAFPDGIQTAFAYGSGAFLQQGTIDISQNMLDFIFVVDNPKKWHEENMKRNKSHYSFLKWFGPRGINYVQEQYGAGIYFNTFVPFADRMIKYGVIGTDRLIIDLLDWETLYVSGRLHKPVLILKNPTNPELNVAIQNNLNSAVHAALIQLPDTFTEEELYTAIANLSYLGDFRMTVGEDRDKVVNIVTPNISKFRAMYQTILENEAHVFYNKAKNSYEQYPNHISQYHHLNLLPKTVHINLVTLGKYNRSIPDTEDVLRNLANDPHCGDYLANCIAQIVKRSSWSQTLKTAFTAGFFKSVKYSFKKMQKMIKSMTK